MNSTFLISSTKFVSFAVGPTIISDFWPVLPTPALPEREKGQHGDLSSIFIVVDF